MSKFREYLLSGVGGVALTRIWGQTARRMDEWTGAKHNARHHSLNGGGIKFISQALQTRHIKRCNMSS